MSRVRRLSFLGLCAGALLGAGGVPRPDPRLTTASEPDRTARAMVLCDDSPGSRLARDNFTLAGQRGSNIMPDERLALVDLDAEMSALEAGMRDGETLGDFRERYSAVLYRLETPGGASPVVSDAVREGAERRCYLPHAQRWCAANEAQDARRCGQVAQRLAALDPVQRAAIEERLTRRKVASFDAASRIGGFETLGAGGLTGGDASAALRARVVTPAGGAVTGRGPDAAGYAAHGRPGAIVPASFRDTGNDGGMIGKVMRGGGLTVPSPLDAAGGTGDAGVTPGPVGGAAHGRGGAAGSDGLVGVGGRRYARRSSEELALIQRTFDASVAAMVREGRRVEGSGALLGTWNNVRSDYGSGQKLKCYDQAHRLLTDLAGAFGTTYSEAAGRFTEPSGKWTFTFSTYHGSNEVERDGHYWVQAVSAVPEDPTLILDPWLNRVERRAEKAPIITKGYASYWLAFVRNGFSGR